MFRVEEEGGNPREIRARPMSLEQPKGVLGRSGRDIIPVPPFPSRPNRTSSLPRREGRQSMHHFMGGVGVTKGSFHAVVVGIVSRVIPQHQRRRRGAMPTDELLSVDERVVWACLDGLESQEAPPSP